MSENITLGTVSSFANDSSAVAIVNSNSSNIATAFTDCLSLSGGQPNAMQSNLDMNKFQVLNLPPPATLLSPVRLTDVVTNGQTITVNTLPVGGSTNALLHKNSGTNYDATWTLTPSGLTSIGATTSTVTTSNVTGTSVYTGSGGGTTILQASATASGTLTIPAATDTLIGKATTDTLTNKTYDTAGTGNVFKINGTGISAITGTGSVVLATSPTLTTPVIGVATGTSLAATGKITSSSPTAGIGYATGAGGVVTQATNKSTGVTLNTLSGQITMNNASLPATINGVSFIVTNSTVAATDTISVSINNVNATAGAYMVNTHSVQAGSFAIKLVNTTAGALSEAVILNFNIVKGVAA